MILGFTCAAAWEPGGRRAEGAAASGSKTSEKKGKLGAYAMKPRALIFRLLGFFEPAKRPDDRADYCLGWGQTQYFTALDFRPRKSKLPLLYPSESTSITSTDHIVTGYCSRQPGSGQHQHFFVSYVQLELFLPFTVFQTMIIFKFAPRGT